MILLLLIQVQCEKVVLVGFANETFFKEMVNPSYEQQGAFWPETEYIAMNYSYKEPLLNFVVKEHNDKQFQFYDIWCFHNNRDQYKITRISPYLDYKIELLYEFIQKGLICFNIYIFEERLIIDCSNYQSINIIEVKFLNNTTHASNLTLNINITLQDRKIYFFQDKIIFLTQEPDNNTIRVYDRSLNQETLTWNKANFNLTSLSIQKIIIQDGMMLVLTKSSMLIIALTNLQELVRTDQEVIPYQREKKFYCTLFVEYIQCIKQDKNFTFYLSYIERINLNQKVKLIDFAQQSRFLFLVTQNYVIVIHVFLDNDVVQNFQLIQIFQSKNEIKQFYYSYYTLYIISSHRGYLSIQKYYEISQFHFKYLGEIDCLGYQIEDQINIMQGINGAEDYYFINSFNDVIVFQLSRSLQDSFQYVIPNATFLQSKKKSFCLLQDQQVQCYNIAFGHSIFNVDIDKFNTFSSVPYQICAQNFKYKKCANYDLKLILIQQKLIVNGYQLIEISYGSQYKIKFDIKQGYIKDLQILDGQAELVDNNVKILEFNQTKIEFQELQDVILLKFLNSSMMIYDKKRQDLQEINNISCLQAYFLTQNHLLCAFKSNILFVYLCDEKWNCAFRNQFLLKNQVIDIQVSGTFVLLNQSTQQQILQYSPKTYELNNIFDLQNSDPTYIQYINQNDFWLIQIWDWQLNINRFITLQKQYEGNIHYIERFNQDNLFTNGDDRIQTIEILAYDQNSISLLFMMKHSIPKAYQIRIDHDQVHLQSLFVLIVNKTDIQQYSFQNNLLVILTRNNMVFYNVSLELNQFERNIIFNLDINKTLGVQKITRINHFYFEEKVYLFAQQLQLCLYQLDIHYKIKMLNYDEKTQININSMNENITMTLEVQYQSDSINMLQIALALVIISIISLFCTLKWCLYFRR